MAGSTASGRCGRSVGLPNLYRAALSAGLSAPMAGFAADQFVLDGTREDGLQ